MPLGLGVSDVSSWSAPVVRAWLCATGRGAAACGAASVPCLSLLACRPLERQRPGPCA